MYSRGRISILSSAEATIPTSPDLLNSTSRKDWSKSTESSHDRKNEELAVSRPIVLAETSEICDL